MVLPGTPVPTRLAKDEEHLGVATTGCEGVDGTHRPYRATGRPYPDILCSGPWGLRCSSHNVGRSARHTPTPPPRGGPIYPRALHRIPGT